MAGYPDEMAQLVSSNPGLASRFPKTIVFPDYSTAELVTIFEFMAAEDGFGGNRFRFSERGHTSYNVYGIERVSAG